MPVKALLLDFDGAIIDSESLLYESWRTVYETFGIELMDLTEADMTIRNGLEGASVGEKKSESGQL